MIPKSIRLFTVLFWASVALSAVDIALQWPAMIDQISSDLALRGLSEQEAIGMSRIVLIFTALLVFALVALLWFLVARKRVGVLRWILLLLAAWSVYLGLSDMVAAPALDLPMTLRLAGTLQLVLAVAFLFRPASQAWFAGPRAA